MNDSTLTTLQSEVPSLSLSELFELIDQTAKNLRYIQRQTVGESGLTPPQYSVLHLLWERDERPFKEFAEFLLCSRATITGIIDTLERKGLVERKPNPEDRRSLLATLTDKGRALQQETPSLENIYNTCCNVLSPIEMQQLSFLLNKLNNSMDYQEVE
jgi:DNA-binding MarR family transcriptional regulator